MNPSLNQKILCYLTPRATEAIEVIQEAGIKDQDLALSVLEKLWPESEIFETSDGGDNE